MTMKPDRSNYELWLIDWIDGKLDSRQTELLMSFLSENPDIREEADYLSVAILKPSDDKSFEKDRIKKTPDDLSVSQIEYLSTAYLENELSDKQRKELEDNISRNSENKKIFDLIQLTRLKAPSVSYLYKHKLTREGRNKRIIRIALNSLSMAATIAVLIISLIFISRFISDRSVKSDFISSSDTIFLNVGIPVFKPPVETDEIIIPEISPASKTAPETMVTDPPPAVNESTETDHYDIEKDAITDRVLEYRALLPQNLAVGEIVTGKARDVLIESGINYNEITFDDSGRSRIRRFIASTFREKVLKDEGFDDSPLKSYEIAEAGVESINKLLGWEMAFVKTRNDDGDIKSVYFSSRILKINAPVKNEDSSL